LTAEQRQHFKAILEDAQTGVVEELVRDRPRIVIQQSADEIEVITDIEAREVAVESLVRQSARLRQIRNALFRIDSDDFGTCLGCGREISLKRLDAVPWTTLCIACQEEADRDNPSSHPGGAPGWAA